jgi:DNA-binding transcriptional LysR family regulator
MDFRQLRYFIAVAKELNFSQAAKKLNIAQPPLSQQIKNLEEELKVQLFYRTKQKVELTVAGRFFFEETQRVIEQYEESVKQTKLIASGKKGKLRVGFVGSATNGILVYILKKFKQLYPDVQLILHEMTTAQQIDALYENRIDIGFNRSNLNDDIIHSEVCSRESLLVVLPESHKLATLSEIPVSYLKDEPFILFPRSLGEQFYDEIIYFFQDNGVKPLVVQEAILMHTIVNLVATGMGISIVPSSLNEYKRSGIVYKTTKEPTPEIRLYVTWRKKHISEILVNFLNTVKEVGMTSYL